MTAQSYKAPKAGCHSVTRHQQVSDLTPRRVDEEIKQLIAGGDQTARGILAAYLDNLHRAGETLREYETVSGA